MKTVLLLAAVCLILTSAPAMAGITNPQIVGSMRAEVIEAGAIEVSGTVSSIQLNLSMPQEDSYQKVDNLTVLDGNVPCSGSCSYGFVYDKYGNRLLSVNWKNVAGNINFEVKSVVSVERRYSVEKKTYTDFLKPTALAQSNDPEIAALASEARGTDFEKVAYLSKWISENIKYNTVYSDVNIPAKEILRLRIGVCKEFSNLLVSFLRSLGYYSGVTVGYVHPGKVYTGENFQPHGWVEVYNDVGILSDPTWGEVGYLDATHIKFATFPDSSWTFSSIYSLGFGTFSVKQTDSTNVSVKILDYNETPLLSSNSSLLESSLGKGYAILKTDLSADMCMMTKFDINSCVDNNGSFLEKVGDENVTYFCGKKSIFTIFKLPELQDKVQYTCPISVVVYGSDQQAVPLTLSSASEGTTRLTVDKTTASPGETVIAQSPGSYVFTDSGDYGLNYLEAVSPYYDFNVYSYNMGALDQQKISIVSVKPLEAYLIVNDTIYAGKQSNVIVSVRNLLSSPQTVTVKFDNQTQREYVSDSKNFTFEFTPTPSESIIQVSVSTNDFSTSLSKTVTVVEEQDIIKGATSFFESVFKAIADFFGRIASLFG